MASDNNSPGIGKDDLVYRDPWGNPYVITMDLNYDEMCEDILYRTNTISTGGFNGLIQNVGDTTHGQDNWAYRGKVMVWSAGPDGKVDGSLPNQGLNKDNVVSWK
jgi:hypothetical protein